MQHVLAHFGSLANVEDTTIPAVADSGWIINNNQYQMPKDMRLIYNFSVGNLLGRVRLITPYTQFMTNPYLMPVYKAAAIVPQIFNPVSFRERPFPLKQSEKLNLAATNTGAGPTATYSICIVEDQFTPAPAGDVYQIRGTGATAAVANTWTSTVVTWTFNLPDGRYGITGGIIYSATALAARLVFPGQFYKPGFFGAVDKTYIPWMPQLRGELGLMGMFDLNTTPTVEIFCSGTDATQEIYLNLIRMG